MKTVLINGKRALCVALLFFYVLANLIGCAPIDQGGAPPSPAPAAAATPTATPEPAAPPAESPENSPAASPFSVNPLAAFYRLWRMESRAGIDALLAALAASNSAQALRLSLALSAHFASLSDLGATVCRLFGDDQSGYADSVAGAAHGEGTMAKREDGLYAYTFYYDDGLILTGEYRLDERASYGLGAYAPDTPNPSAGSDPFKEPTFEAVKSCTIEKTAEGWASTVEEDGAFSAFESASGAIVFVWGDVAARLADGALTIGPAPTEGIKAPSR